MHDYTYRFDDPLAASLFACLLLRDCPTLDVSKVRNSVTFGGKLDHVQACSIETMVQRVNGMTYNELVFRYDALQQVLSPFLSSFYGS